MTKVIDLVEFAFHDADLVALVSYDTGLDPSGARADIAPVSTAAPHAKEPTTIIQDLRTILGIVRLLRESFLDFGDGKLQQIDLIEKIALRSLNDSARLCGAGVSVQAISGGAKITFASQQAGVCRMDGIVLPPWAGRRHSPAVRAVSVA